MNLERNASRSVYCVYLLRALNPKWKASQYVGFTNNPPRRIRQHNGELKGGARKTQRKRPWEMVLFIYGFPTKHSALQFEWSWQNPSVSRLVKHKLSKKTWYGLKGKIKVLPEMLNMTPFANYALTINWTKPSLRETYGPLMEHRSLPSTIKVTVRPLNGLLYFHKKGSGDSDHKIESDQIEGDLLDEFPENISYRHPTNLFCDCCRKTEDLSFLKSLSMGTASTLRVELDQKFMKCPDPQCDAIVHSLCLSKKEFADRLKAFKASRISTLKIIPETAKCPKCRVLHRWPEWVRHLLRFKDGDIESDDDDEGDDDGDEEQEDENEDVYEDIMNVYELENAVVFVSDEDVAEDRNDAGSTNHKKETSLSVSVSDDEDDDLGLSLAERLRRRGVMR